MTREKKLHLNSIAALIQQFVSIICGMILPKFFLANYGSAVNGLVSSITQFLGFISLCEMGIGTVVQASLYKPLAEKDDKAISRICASAQRFFNKVAFILLIYVFVLALVFPFKTSGQFDTVYTVSLVVILSLSLFAQYYFSMVYRLLLNADQLAFVSLGLHALLHILNTVSAIVLMHFGAPIHLVKFASSLIFFLNPVILTIYVKKHYHLDKKIKVEGEVIKQKWNGFAQHLSAVIHSDADSVILTVFSSFENVSVYSVYNLVVGGLRMLVRALNTGVMALFGNMIAKNEKEELKKAFLNIEWKYHTISTFLYTCAYILLIPFVRVYTMGLTDADYIQPLFCAIICLAQFVFCIQLPYLSVSFAAGHFKETQASSFIEAGINIVLSVILVKPFGLVGIAIGTLCAVVFRFLYLVIYLHKNIIYRSYSSFFRQILADGITLVLSLLFTRWIPMETENFFSWVLLALPVAGIVFLCVAAVNLVLFPKNLPKLRIKKK